MTERLMFFNKRYPYGCIRTEQVELSGKPFYRATITPDIANPARYFTGHAPAVAEKGLIFRKTTLLEGAEQAAVDSALLLVVPVTADDSAQNGGHKTKTGVCQECGSVWKRTDDQDSGILGTCPECRIKKRLFLRLKVL